jgi:hypothetical protein
MKGELKEYNFQFTSQKQFHACHQSVNLSEQAYFRSLAAKHTAGTKVATCLLDLCTGSEWTASHSSHNTPMKTTSVLTGGSYSNL